MEILSVGDDVKSGIYILHSTFEKVKNFVSSDRLISVVSSQVGAGPNLIISDYFLTRSFKQITVKDNKLFFGEFEYDFDNGIKYSSNLHIQKIDYDFFRYVSEIPQRYSDLLDFDSLFFLLKEKYFPKTVFQKNFFQYAYDNTRDLSIENISNVVAKMKGLGIGLTPSGDDFNAGIIYALHIIKIFIKKDLSDIIETCYQNSLGKNKISNTFLYYSYKNMYFSDFKNFLNNLGKYECEYYLQKLLSHGHTSGSDLLAGFILTIKNNIDRLEFN